MECANRWLYRCVCNKQWFRQEHGGPLPAARGSRVQVTWLKASSLAEFQVGGHPLYSPDLSPCDYAIFGTLKKALKGKWFTSDDVKQYVRNWFTTQPREFYETAIRRLVSQWASASRVRANTSDIDYRYWFLFLRLRFARFSLNARYMMHFHNKFPYNLSFLIGGLFIKK